MREAESWVKHTNEEAHKIQIAQCLLSGACKAFVGQCACERLATQSEASEYSCAIGGGCWYLA